jgi:nitrite reductase/ring-hydroxylating ferredoxin subunit
LRQDGKDAIKINLPMEKNSNLDRRNFLKEAIAFVAGGTLVSTFGGCSTGLASYFVRTEGNTLHLSVNEFPQLRDVGGAIEIEFMEVPGHLVVVRTGPDSFAALSPRCTHLGCTVRKEPSFFRCPCHGSTYTLEGEVVRGPAEKPLTRYEVRLVEDKITIAL